LTVFLAAALVLEAGFFTFAFLVGMSIS